jgi:hypothetical protein
LREGDTVTELESAPVVSVIVPCLHGENYYEAFFDAVKRQFGERGRRIAVDNFSWNSVAADLLESYRERREMKHANRP